MKCLCQKKIILTGCSELFADSLPDAWGQLLLERLLKERGKKEAQYSVLDRLATWENLEWEL